MILILMGVMGTGKTTIARLFVERTGWTYAEGDDYHPKANVEKMHAGIPLTDEDREPWLAALHMQIAVWDEQGTNAVLTCSALKQKYRDVLAGNIASSRLRFVLLEASRATLEKHLAGRKGHFMNPALLDSQLAILEIPADAIRISVEDSPERAVAQLLAAVSGLNMR
jgi:gluconokinase